MKKVPCLLGLLHPPFLMRRSHAHCSIASYCIAVASCKMYDRQIAVVWWFKFQNLMTNDLNYMFDYAMLRMNQSAEAVPAICTEHLTLSCSLWLGFIFLVCLFCFVCFRTCQTVLQDCFGIFLRTSPPLISLASKDISPYSEFTFATAAWRHLASTRGEWLPGRHLSMISCWGLSRPVL